MKLCEHVRRKWPELWWKGWILHQDNVPAHNTLSVKQFLANKNITELEHPPYSPDLAPCDFYLFPKIKSVLKGTHFVLVENAKAKKGGDPQQPYRTWPAELLWTLAASHAAVCQLSRELFEGRRSWFPEFVKQKELQVQSRFLVSDLVTLYASLHTEEQ